MPSFAAILQHQTFPKHNTATFDKQDEDATGIHDTWAKHISTKSWALTFNIWKHGSQILHETEAVQSLSGMDSLKEAIRAKYILAQDIIPMPYSLFFYLPLLLLLRKLHTYFKHWFMTIRAGRESYYEEHTIIDGFTTDTTLRVWIRLAPLE